MSDSSLFTEEGPVRCWCGELLTDEALELMAEGLPDRCGGSGVLYCECGGDLCVCHNHGEAECFGCKDCEGDDDDFGDDNY